MDAIPLVCSSPSISWEAVWDAPYITLHRFVWKLISIFGLSVAKKVTSWWFQICFIFTPIPGEMIQFDEHIFQMGWNHQLVSVLINFHLFIMVHTVDGRNAAPPVICETPIEKWGIFSQPQLMQDSFHQQYCWYCTLAVWIRILWMVDTAIKKHDWVPRKSHMPLRKLQVFKCFIDISFKTLGSDYIYIFIVIYKYCNISRRF